MRARVFFPLVLILALALISYALSPLYMKKPATGQNYTHSKVGLYLDGMNLNNIINYDKAKFAVSLAPGTASPQIGPRFISKSKSDGSEGVIFNLPPSLIAELAQKPAHAIILNYQPIGTAPAGFVKFSFVDDKNNAQSFEVTNPKGNKISRFSFVGERKIIKQIVINPALEGEDHGIELMSVVIEN